VLNRDNPQYGRLAAAARRAGTAVIGFGAHPEASARLIDCVLEPAESAVEAMVDAAPIHFQLPLPGRHWVMNALAVLAASLAVGADPKRVAAALGRLEALPGRGRRHRIPWRGGTLTLIDESYNASPASMAAALAVLGATRPEPGGRRVAVLGDMLELGDAAARFHRELAPRLASAKIDRAFLIGAEMAALSEALPPSCRGGLWRSAEEAIPALFRFLAPGDVVTVKGSYGMRLGCIVERLLNRPET
jgi:UDP-N-acetylmuramoyl-tripeptide--D-alanyl-D-alanine ligase